MRQNHLEAFYCCSVTVMSDSLQPHRLQHTRLPCPSPSPEACSNSCLLSQWCHEIISSSVSPFFSHLQSFPASGSFPVSWLFASGGPSTAAWASVLPMNIQLVSTQYCPPWLEFLIQCVVGPKDCVSNMYADNAEADTACPVFRDHWPRYTALKPFVFKYIFRGPLYLSTPSKRQTKN